MLRPLDILSFVVLIIRGTREQVPPFVFVNRDEGPCSSAGFTLIELVAVIVILGVVAVFAMARMGDLGFFGRRAYSDELVAAVRFAQKRAVASGCAVQVQIASSPPGYALFQQAACNSGAFSLAVASPTGGNFAAPAPSGVSVGPAVNITFDALGRATSGAGTTVTVGDRTFVVASETGYVTAN